MRRTPRSNLVLLTLALCGTAAGQDQPADPAADGGPVIVGTPRESWSSFDLTKLDAAIEFRWQYRNDVLKQDGQPDQTTRETRYRETVDLSTQAAIGHKNLIELTGALQLGLEDVYSKITPGGVDDHERDTVDLYDLSALLFGASDLPTTIYARREQSRLDRAFAATIDEVVTEQGVESRFQTEASSTSIRFYHREDQLKGAAAGVDTSVRQNSLALNSGIRLSDRQKLDIGYTFDDISEQQAGGYTDSYGRHDASLVHTYTFDDEARPDELRSSLRVFDQSGLQSQDHVRWDELLTLRHTDRLETRYSAVLDSLTIRGQEQQLSRGEASVRYRLFDSLTSVGALGGQHLDAPGGFTSDDLFANGSLDYTKKVPKGRLDAALGAGFNAQSNSERGSALSVSNEAYTFTDAFPVILPRRNIVAGSIVVTPPGGFPVYQEGLDYTVQVFPDHAEIRGVVGGALVNGQTILVSYDVGPEGASDIATTTTTASVRYSITEGWLDGIAFYSTLRTVGHSVSAKDPSLYRLDDVTDLLLGVEYRFAEFDLKYEFNNHDSTFDPYTVHRLQALYTLPLAVGSSVNAELTREMIDFSSQDNSVVFDRASLRWNYRMNRALDFTARLEYRNEDSTLNGESRGFEQSIGFSYHRAQTTIYGNLRNALLDGPASSQTTQFLELGIRRTF